MSKEQDKIWRDKKGRPITFADCKDAVHTAISCMTKALVTNPVIQESQKLSISYERQIGVLEVVRDKFDMLAKQAKKVQRKTIKKRGTSKTH